MIVAQPIRNHQFSAPLRVTIKGAQKPRSRRRRTFSPMTKIFFTGLVLALLLLAYVTVKNQVMTYTYQYAELQKQLEKAMIQRDRLSLEILGLKSLERIEAVARAHLGMVEPATIKYVAVAPSPELAVPASGAERVVTQVAEYISGLLTSVVKAAGLYEGR